MALILAIALVLILSAFFSGSEIAFVSANRLGIELKRSSGSRRGKRLAELYDEPDRFLAIMLVGNNIALVVFSWLMTRMLEPVIREFIPTNWLVLLASTILITGIVLIFGEFLPKTFFRLYANSLLHFFAYPLILFKWLLALPVWIMTNCSNLFLKYVLRVPMNKETSVITRLDLENFVSHKQNESEDELEADMFKNALHLKKVKVRHCMVPRTEIKYLDVTATIDELITMFRETRHSRILICDGDIEHVLGYVHHQQLLSGPKSIRKIILEIPIIPETMNVKDLLLRFMKDGPTIACVVDEFGGTSGLITMEDILEEIFGEIEDEHDMEEHVEIEVSENEFIFSGRLEIDYLNEKYEKIVLPVGEYSTLSGYLVMKMATIPEQGEELEMDGYRFVLESVSEKKIETVRLSVLETVPEP